MPNKNDSIEDLSSPQIEEHLDNIDRPDKHNVAGALNRPIPKYGNAYTDAEEDAWLEMERKMKETEDPSKNNGGKTDYYKLKPEWKMAQDIIEERQMNYAQGNIFKVAFTFNLGRHDAALDDRELHKIIYFAQRLLDENRKL